MSDWNFDMSQAPRGSWRTVTRKIDKNEFEKEEHVPDLIIAAGNDGVVTVSKWLPREGRWSMFTAAVPPMAWMLWPSHPETSP